MTVPKRLVIDANLLVSRALLASSPAGRAVERAMESGVLLFSTATFAELADVLLRKKFDPYVSVSLRHDYLTLLRSTAIWVEIERPVNGVCRDPKDDRILELAINGRADLILTGDKDLLVLDSYLGIPILSAAHLLAQP